MRPRDLADRADQGEWIGVGVHEHRKVSAIERKDEVEAPVIAHHEIVQPAAIDITAPRRELDQDGVYDELFPPFAFASVRLGGASALPQKRFATTQMQRSVADEWGELEDRIEELFAFHEREQCIRDATQRGSECEMIAICGDRAQGLRVLDAAVEPVGGAGSDL